MKAKLFLLSLMTGLLLLGACKKDKDENELSRTTWEYSTTQFGITIGSTIHFVNDTEFTMTASIFGITESTKGTYVYEKPTVKLTAKEVIIDEEGVTEGETTTITGTVEGNNLTIIQEGIPIVLKKK